MLELCAIRVHVKSCSFLLICKLFPWLSFCFLLLSCFVLEGRIQTHTGNFRSWFCMALVSLSLGTITPLANA